jgi:hypothetical protein
VVTSLVRDCPCVGRKPSRDPARPRGECSLAWWRWFCGVFAGRLE